ncbi:MAG: hypothetical protein QW650_00085 [Thermofilum sp.]
MFYAVGLTTTGFRRAWAYESLNESDYVEKALKIKIFALKDEKGHFVDFFLPTENVYISSYLLYFNIPSRLIVNGKETRKHEDAIVIERSMNYPAGRYELVEGTMADFFEKFAWKLPKLRLPSISNYSIFVAALGKKIADAVWWHANVVDEDVEEVLKSSWYEWLVHYVLHKKVKLTPEQALEIVQNESISVSDAIEFVGRTYRDVVISKAIFTIVCDLEPIVQFYLENPAEVFLFDAERRNLNLKFSEYHLEQS